jgi:uncharacterized protein
MKIVIDILHYPHMNFFKNSIFHFLKKGIDIDIIVQPRGNLEKMVKYEYGLPYTLIGSFEKSYTKKIFGYIIRDISIYQYLRKSDFNVAISVASVNIAHAAFLLQKPSIFFYDDPEYSLNFNQGKYFSTHTVVPRSSQAKGKILRYKGFKELAYLHPNYFSPSSAVLSEYNLKQNQYVFIREVSGSTMNYSKLEEGYLSLICPYLKDMGYDIVLSLEDHTQKEKFSKYCTILNEPVSDIHSLMHYAAATIASGDSMARESVLLKTPAIYTGKREMAINSELIKKGCFFKRENLSEIVGCMKQIIEKDIKKKTDSVISDAIKTEWVDTTKVIIDVVSSELYDDPTLIQEYIE